MLSPAALGALDEPFAINVLDEDAVPAPSQGSPESDVPTGALLVSFEHGRLRFDAPLEKFALVAFRGLHLAVVADHAAVARLAELSPVSSVAQLHESFAWTRPLVQALDEVALLLILNQLPAAQVNPHVPKEVLALRFGGRSPDEPFGYPTWDGEPEHEIQADGAQWPSEPLLLPVINLSLGPNSVRFPVDAGDAVQAATFFLARACVICAAAGNSGEIDGASTLSAWAQVPWVIAVGATEAEDGGNLLSRSSCGLPDQPETWPDVVAYGSSALNPALHGTSFAAPRVAYSALLATAALFYLRHLVQLAGGGSVEGIRLLGVCSVDRFSGEKWYEGPLRLPVGVLPAIPNLDAIPRVGEMFAALAAGGWDGSLELGPQQARALVLASARPLAKTAAYKQGKGFVSAAGLCDLLTDLSAERWLALLNLQPYARALPPQLRARPLFSAADVEKLDTLLRSTMQLVMIDYPSGNWRFRPDIDEEAGT